MKYLVNRIIVISILIVILSVLDFLDYYIVKIFHFKDDVLFKLIFDLLSFIFELSLLIWALITGKNIIRKIKDEEELYKRLVQLSPHAVLIHDRGRILYINDSGAKLFGSSFPNELVNRNISEYIHRDSINIYNNLTKEADDFPDDVLNKQVKIKRSDGAIIDLEYKSKQISFNGQAARELIARDITVQRKEIENVKRLAYQDELTGLPNRRAFMEQLTTLLNAPEELKTRFSIMFIDLDGFKQVNDTIGHKGGDILLKHASDKFIKCVANKGIVARLAGDEFIVLLHNISQHDPVVVAKDIIESFCSPTIVMGKKVRVTTSIGIALYPQHGYDATELINNADMAMYMAKQQGKNKFQLFNDFSNETS